MSKNAFISLLAGLLLLGALGAGAAQAARARSAPTGTWAGSATYVSPEGSGAPGVEYRSAITVTSELENGRVRIDSLYATVRTYCLSGIRDIRLLESRRPGKGPLVGRGGAFSFSARGATIQGVLGRNGASGSITASVGGCDLEDGTWKAVKRQ